MKLSLSLTSIELNSMDRWEQCFVFAKPGQLSTKTPWHKHLCSFNIVHTVNIAHIVSLDIICHLVANHRSTNRMSMAHTGNASTKSEVLEAVFQYAHNSYGEVVLRRS